MRLVLSRWQRRRLLSSLPHLLAQRSSAPPPVSPTTLQPFFFNFKMRNTNLVALVLSLSWSLIVSGDRTCLRCYGGQCDGSCTGQFCYLIKKSIHSTVSEDYGCIDETNPPTIAAQLGACQVLSLDDHRDRPTDTFTQHICYCNDRDNCNDKWTDKVRQTRDFHTVAPLWEVRNSLSLYNGDPIRCMEIKIMLSLTADVASKMVRG